MKAFDLAEVNAYPYAREAISAADGAPLEVLIAYPEGTPKSILLFIHGGGWRSDSCERMLPHIRYAALCGAVGVSASYRLLSEKTDVRDGLKDCLAVLDFVRTLCRERYGELPVVALGDSAGGYYAACLGCRKLVSKIRCGAERADFVVDWNGITDLTGKWSYGIVQKPSDESEKEQTEREFSPLYAAAEGDAPVLIMHGDRDKTVPLSDAYAYRDALDEAGVPAQLCVLEGAAHAFILFGYHHDDGYVASVLRAVFAYLAEKNYL